jgi:hypothetical protein
LADVGERIESRLGTTHLHRLSFSPDATLEPQGELVGFSSGAAISWSYDLSVARIRRRVELDPAGRGVAIHYRVEAVVEPLQISLLPLVTARSAHALVAQNPLLNGRARPEPEGFALRPYPGERELFFGIDGVPFSFVEDGVWYSGIDHAWERERGYAAAEDFYVPGEIRISVAEHTEFSLWCGVESMPSDLARGRFTVHPPSAERSSSFIPEVGRGLERFALHAEAGPTIGYPWYENQTLESLWALRGAYLEKRDVNGALHELSRIARKLEARRSLVDTLAFLDTLRRVQAAHPEVLLDELLVEAAGLVDWIVAGEGQYFSVNADGELFVEPGPARTWMNADVDGVPVTPRFGFVVELNAQWLSALSLSVELWQRRSGSPLLPIRLRPAEIYFDAERAGHRGFR